MTLRNHPGQIAFPGGSLDEGETFAEAALRETEEEVGIPSSQITLLGELAGVYIPPSNFFVQPFVGWHEGQPEYIPAPAEVGDVLEVPMAHFADDGNRSQFEAIKGFMVPSFRVQEHEVWGATAAMLNELTARLSETGLFAV